MTSKETAVLALENLANNLDTTASIMRQLGNPYRQKALELAGAWEMVQEWVEAIKQLEETSDE